jgi:hypothetical protein
MREELKKQILERAKYKAQILGYNITSEVEIDLKDFINNGVDRMSTSEYLSSSDNLRAIYNIEILIDRMQIDAKSRFITESLDYKSLSNARASICPLWPFC